MKRRKKRQKTTSRSINDLPDSMLTEILTRVSTHESVMSCKFVCKLWNSLISRSDFASSFITHHAAVQGEYQKHIIIVHVMESVPDYGTRLREFQLVAGMSTPSHESPCYASTFAKHLRVIAGFQKDASISILASYNDLLLCAPSVGLRLTGNFASSGCSLFLCNPFTMERLDIPKPPLSCGAVALMCEPYCFTDAQGRYHLQHSNRRFTIVCFSHPVFSVDGVDEVAQFCSETGAWSKPVLELRNETNIVAYKGKFYWVGRERANFTEEHFVVYDPSSGARSATQFSCFPEVDRSGGWRCGWNRPACFGVCNGVLRVMRLFISNGGGDDGLITLCVWELKDNNGTDEKLWSLEKCIASHQMTSQDDSVLRIVSSPSQNRNIELLAFDPSNEDIVYMSLHRCTVSCNLRTRNLEVLIRIPLHVGLDSVINHMVFPLAQPWWPTPTIRS